MVVSVQTCLLVWKSLPRRVWYCSKTRAAFWCKCGTCWRVLGKRAGNDFFFVFPCWMASPTRWTWVWVNSGSWWWTGRPGVLRFMGSQRVGHDWATENWTEYTQRKLNLCLAKFSFFSFFFFLPTSAFSVPVSETWGAILHGSGEISFVRSVKSFPTLLF